MVRHEGPLNELQRRRHKRRNLAQSIILLAGLGGLMAASGWLFAGLDGIIGAVVAATAAILLNPAVAPQMVLHLYGAQTLSPYEVPELHELTAALARRAGLPALPMLYYVPSPVLNAFAVGTPRQAAIAVTDGLLRRLSLRELAGVLAHEISHIRNNDLWIMGLADTISRLTIAMSYGGMLLVLLNFPLIMLGQATVSWFLILLLVSAPTLAALLQLALSRTREFDADLDAAGFTGDPAGLASALAKLENQGAGTWERILLPGRRVPDPSLLRTHPDTEERIRRLLELRAPDIGWPQVRPLVLPPSFRPPSPARGRWPGMWY